MVCSTQGIYCGVCKSTNCTIQEHQCGFCREPLRFHADMKYPFNMTSIVKKSLADGNQLFFVQNTLEGRVVCQQEAPHLPIPLHLTFYHEPCFDQMTSRQQPAEVPLGLPDMTCELAKRLKRHFEQQKGFHQNLQAEIYHTVASIFTRHPELRNARSFEDLSDDQILRFLNDSEVYYSQYLKYLEPFGLYWTCKFIARNPELEKTEIPSLKKFAQLRQSHLDHLIYWPPFLTRKHFFGTSKQSFWNNTSLENELSKANTKEEKRLTALKFCVYITVISNQVILGN